MSINFGSIIQKRRKELNLSQEKLAEIVNVNERTIRRIENNEGAGKKILTAICEALHISVQETEDKLRTPKMAIRIPNIQSSRDLAHILVNAEHVEVDDQIHNDDFEEEWLVDSFLKKCEEVFDAWDEGAPEQNQVLLAILQKEMDKLKQKNIWVSGSCTDSLVSNFKIAHLSFFKY